MTTKEILQTAILFHPKVNDPCVIKIDKDEIRNALDKHYHIVDNDIETQAELKYQERGYIFSISKRVLRNITGDVYQALLDESDIDIKFALRTLICGRLPNFIFLVCSYHNSFAVMAEVQQVISSFNFKFDYKIKMEVLHETNCA